MKYKNIVKAKFIRKLNRFAAEVELEGEIKLAHLPTTARLRELLIPGATCYLEEAANKNRKTPYTITSIVKNGEILNIVSTVANDLVYNSILNGEILSNLKIKDLKKEVKFSHSRFDMGFTTECGEKGFIEVKSVNLKRNNIAMFPGSPTQRGRKHLKELSHAKRNGFVNIYHYTDDGVSGTTFDRQGFQKMIKAVEENKVSTVIVKDMSRFGRDYLKVGFYTEILFKEKGVRFIAINNGIDSEKQAESDFTPFLNIMNEWYARDTSRKIQSIFRARMEEGKRVSPSVPYGYFRNPKNKQELLVDKESAKVVKRIYRLVIEGYGVTQIADILTKDKVLIPSAYAEIHYPESNHSSKKRGIEDPYFWTPTTVSYILEKKRIYGTHRTWENNMP